MRNNLHNNRDEIDLDGKIDRKIDKRIDKKINKEKKVVKLMIMKYCKGHNHSGNPCADCSQLIEYVEGRIERCPFTETKTYCSNCKRHCYRPDMKERIREVMRYSGPRMILSHPIITIDHVYQGIKHNIKRKYLGKNKK